MDRATAIFVEGMGAATAASGVLTQLQGRIFGFIYLQSGPVSLDEITTELGISKGNVSVNIRGLVDWHLVRRVSVPGSRKDHYEAASDFWRVVQEIMERRFRWNIRQVIAACDETVRAANEGTRPTRRGNRGAEFLAERLNALRSFASAVDEGIGAFSQGVPLTPEALRVVPIRGPRREKG
ncbi:MAG: GbsR/MarR family transcriptional regulator [Actinomycetota bacterium]